MIILYCIGNHIKAFGINQEKAMEAYAHREKGLYSLKVKELIRNEFRKSDDQQEMEVLSELRQ